MNRNVLILVSLSLIATGCASNSGGAGIDVDTFSVQPSQIVSGSTVFANVEAVNYGKLEGQVNIGEDGRNVLVNYCPDIFGIEEFNIPSSEVSNTENSYNLGSEEIIRMNWRLKQKEDRTVPRDGYNCDMRFELPFKYSVTAYKQLQIKESREVEGSSNLGSDISEGPLAIDMELIGSTAESPNTIIKGDDASIYVTAYNTEESESGYQGLVEISDIEITGGGDVGLADNCGQQSSISLKNGEENVYRCNIDYDEDFNPSSISGEVTASINYTFTKDVGSRRVRVDRRGN